MQSPQAIPTTNARAYVVISVLSVLSALAIFGYISIQNRQQTLDQAVTDSGNLSRVLEDHFEMNLRRIDADLFRVVNNARPEELRQESVPQYRDAWTHSLASLKMNFPEVSNVYVFDSAGFLLYASYPGLKPFSAAERSHFKILRDDPNAGLVFSEVFVAKTTGLSTIAIGRGFRDSQGRFLGMVTALLDLKYLQDLFKSIDVGQNGIIALRRSDNHKLLLRRPELLQETNSGVASPITRKIAAGSRSGVERFASPVDGIARIWSYRMLHDYPFVVSVAISEDEALAAWRQRLLLATFMVATFLLLLSAAMLRLIRTERRRSAAIQALAESEAQQREERNFSNAVFNAMGNIGLVIGRDGAIIRFNKTAEAFTGYGFDEVRDKPFFWKKFLLPEQRDGVEKVFERFTTGTLPSNYENYWVGKNGEKRLLAWSNTSLKDQDGTPQYLVTIGLDITERKKNADALAESEGRFRKFFEQNSSVMLLIDPLSGAIVAANHSASVYYGYAPEQLVTLNIGAINTLSPEEITAERLRALREERSYFNFQHRLASGEIRAVEVHSTPIDIAEKNLLFSIIHDITERKHADAERNRLLKIIEQAPDFIAVSDMQARIKYINRAGMKMVGLSDGVDITLLEIKDMHPQWATRRVLEEGIPAVLQQAFWYGETALLHSGGHETPVSQVLLLHRDESGKPEYLSTIMRDITERKQAEKEILRSNSELEQFCYAISHDMRQPLRMITSYMQLLEKELLDQLDAEKRQFFDFAIDGAKRMDTMMLGLLEYSRVGRKGEPAAWIESRVVLENALLFLRPAIAETQADVRIEGDWPRIHVSPDEILRLVQNLVGNALKFRVSGRKPAITVASQMIGKEWRLCVTDNGVGIPPDQVSRLFQMFQRLQSRTAYEGTGIGLALCRRIAEHHHGRIWVESAGDGQGSQFFVAIPQNASEDSFGV